MNSPAFWVFVGLLSTLLQSSVLASFDENAKKSNKAISSDSKPVLSSSKLRQTYIDYCLHCHGRDGRPTALVERVMSEIPDFSRYDWEDYDSSDVIASISDGTGQMPGFRSMLTKMEMASLAKMLTKFPSGRPGSMIERRNRFLAANRRFIEKISEIDEALESLRHEKETER